MFGRPLRGLMLAVADGCKEDRAIRPSEPATAAISPRPPVIDVGDQRSAITAISGMARIARAAAQAKKTL